MNGNDLISRALALEVINAVKGVTWSQSGKVLCGKMFSQIKDLLAVDAVSVVRCKDCKHWHEDIGATTKWLMCHEIVTDRNWFCADGERRDDDADD